MKICLLGSTGFLGKHIFKRFSKKFSITKINLRKMPDYQEKGFINFLDKFNKSDIIINCAANLSPKSKRDFFINEDFPKILYNHLKKNNKKFKFIHMSTVNVLIKDRKDTYTKSKRKSEKKLFNTKTEIIRLPLLIDKKKGYIQNNGNLSALYRYLDVSILPIYPMLFPGHLYQPVTIHKLTDFINKIILQKNNIGKIYNISGKTKKSLWDLFEEIAIFKSKIFFKIDTRIINLLLPSFLKNVLREKNSFLQQLISIDNTTYSKKIIL